MPCVPSWRWLSSSSSTATVGIVKRSLYLAADLGSLYGLPPENIYVIVGLNEWKEREMPVITGSEAR